MTDSNEKHKLRSTQNRLWIYSKHYKALGRQAGIQTEKYT